MFLQISTRLQKIANLADFSIFFSKKRMHSSRMRTARSLTVSHSIQLRGLPNAPPRCGIPQMQTPLDADPPDADPQMQTLPWMQTPPGCRPSWMQTPLDADPPDADPS